MECNIFKKVLIGINTDISSFNLKPSFLEEEGFISLYVDPDKYKISNEGETSKLSPSFKGSFIDSGLVRRNISIDFDYHYFNLYNALVKISIECFKTKNLIQLVDYIRPEVDDVSQGYTTRLGLLKIMNDSGMVTNPTNNTSFLVNPFTIEFQENKYYYV